MTARPPISRLGYALLGLLGQQPRSGYALRQVFARTPMGNYSSSPGSIYPALKGLERERLIERRAATPARQCFALTARGRKVLDDWLTGPVDGGELVRHLDLALLRFAFLQQRQDPVLTDHFLAAFHDALRGHADSLRSFLESDAGTALPLQAQLAVGHGLRTAMASAEWAADARLQLAEESRTGTKEKAR